MVCIAGDLLCGITVGIQCNYVPVEQETTQGLRKSNVRIVPFNTVSYCQWWSDNQGWFISTKPC